jgi:hypothetical protein
MQVLNFVKILLLGAELFHVDEKAERHYEVNIRFSRFCKSACNNFSSGNKVYHKNIYYVGF